MPVVTTVVPGEATPRGEPSQHKPCAFLDMVQAGRPGSECMAAIADLSFETQHKLIIGAVYRRPGFIAEPEVAAWLDDNRAALKAWREQPVRGTTE